jgi:hypothetical protein
MTTPMIPVPVIHIQAALQSTETFSGGHVTIGSQNQSEAVQFQFQQFNSEAQPLFQESITVQGQDLLSNLDFTGNGSLALAEQLDISIPMPTFGHLWF